MKRANHLNSLIRILAAAVAVVGFLPSLLRAEPRLIEESGLTGGIVVALDFSDGKSIADLAVKGNFAVHGLLTTDAGVDKARSEIKQAGFYGKVSCDGYNGRDLPYVDSLVNLVLCKAACKVPTAELMRVLAPGGLLMVEESGAWKRTVKPAASGSDEWNQFLHGADNNGVSRDDVGPPQRLRWHDGPEYGRSKALSPSFTSMVSAGGLIFTIEDHATTEDVNAPVEYHLVARDAFNGIELWQKPMKQWDAWQTHSIKSIPTQQQRLLAAIGKSVYGVLEFGGPVVALEARSGKQQRVYANTERTREFAIAGRVLYGIKGNVYKLSRTIEPEGDVELFALDLQQGTQLWTKTIRTEYTGGSLTVKGQRLVYHSTSGLTCVDSTTGKDHWTEAVVFGDAEGVQQAKPKKNQKAKQLKDYSIFTGNAHPSIVLTDDSVFCAIGKSIAAMSLTDGKTLWTAVGDTNYEKSPDLFVADGLVWNRDMKGRDPNGP